MLTVGSMFAGIGGFDLGFEREGFVIAWAIEKDKRAQAVLRKRFPNTKIYGDITEVDPESLEKVDVICGGFPCQDLSVAGKRAGLKGDRSGLFFDAMRIVRAISPRILILENVPGLLTSNRGLDFAAVIREVGEGWGCAEVAWRILDSQWFGVAQRRKRCFVVASSRLGCSEQILALSESVSGDPPSRAKEGQVASSDSQVGARVDGKWWDGRDVSASMTTRCHDQFMPDKGNFAAVVIDRAAFNQGVNAAYDPKIEECDVMPAIVARGPHAVAFRKSKRAQSSTDSESWVNDEVSNTLNGFDLGDSRTTHAIAIPIQDGREILKRQNGFGVGSETDPSYTLDRTGAQSVAFTGPSMIVRRLMPVEAERLQGFPDGWTDIGTTEKPTPDLHRYKQLGNAVTVNVSQWIARRARNVLEVSDVE